MRTIGERIKARREELGLTQDELAKKLGYSSRTSVTKIENDTRNLTQSKIKAIADALDTTPSYIMGWDEEDELSQNENALFYPYQQNKNSLTGNGEADREALIEFIKSCNDEAALWALIDAANVRLRELRS